MTDNITREKAEYLFTMARRHKERGKDAEHREALARYAEALRALVSQGGFPEEELPAAYARLYIAGAHKTLFEFLERSAAAGNREFLARLAAASAFGRAEPQKALEAAQHMGTPEFRQLVRKTAALWDTLHAPLPEEPRVHLLILTYNREAYAEQALRELAATNYRNYAVFIADNGSSDGTRAIAERARDIFPAHVPVAVQAFPTNIGRPAGHNWLLTGHDHSAAEFIAIGDDDLTRVPPDWLTRMVQTARAFPGCACVGGKALSPGWPAMVHGGVRNITAFGDGVLDISNGDEQADMGQFDYVDIVDHVIGCLHIFNRRELEDTGLFDISLSPCQCVDIEHHLRMRLAGKQIIFNGLIAFEHMRAMGRATTQDKRMGGNAVGNVLKLLYKYTPADVHAALAERRRERDVWLETL